MELAYDDSFFHVLNYIYTGKLILKKQELYRIFDFMSIARTIHLTGMLEDMSLLLKKGLTLENVVLIYEKASEYDQVQLRISCEQFIDKNADVLVNQKSLVKMSSECLKRIISRDSFGLVEVKIFQLVEEWHVFHNRTKNLNIELIQKIRFELIPNEELSNLISVSKITNDQIVLQVVNETMKLNGNPIKPTRRGQIPTTTTTTTTITTTTTPSITSTTANIFHNKLASGSKDNSIKLWDVDTGECLRTLTGHSGTVISLHLLPNNILASGSLDKSIKLWNVSSGECIRTLNGHSEYVYALQLLAKNKLASGSWDRSIKIWNINTGECIRTMTGHSGAVVPLKLLTHNKLASG